MARAYAQEPDPVPAQDPLDARNMRMLMGTDDAGTKLRRARMLADKSRDALVPPARIVPEDGTERPGYGFHHRCLSEDQTRRLVEKELPGTVNVLLVATLHVAVDAWNQEHGAGSRRIGGDGAGEHAPARCGCRPDLAGLVHVRGVVDDHLRVAHLRPVVAGEGGVAVGHGSGRCGQHPQHPNPFPAPGTTAWSA